MSLIDSTANRGRSARRRLRAQGVAARAGADRADRRQSDAHPAGSDRRARREASATRRRCSPTANASATARSPSAPNRYARWALEQGLGKGDVVCLLMPNRPEYMAIWLGITRVGGVVALLNTNLAGRVARALHRHRRAQAHHRRGRAARRHSRRAPRILRPGRTIWSHGDSAQRLPRHRPRDRAPFGRRARRRASARASRIDDRALYIYTSGTTGLPKAANVSHHRLMQWSHWFAGMMDTGAERPHVQLPADVSQRRRRGGDRRGAGRRRLGGDPREVLGAAGSGTTSSRWDCTLFQYIGELCRYLRQRAAASARDARTAAAVLRQRACGPTSGRSSRAASAFRRSSNSTPRPKATSRCTTARASPARSAASRRSWRTAFRLALVQVRRRDRRAGARRRRASACAARPDEVGEAIGRIGDDGADAGGRFEGYTDAAASEQEDPARRVRAGRRLVSHRRSDAQGRAAAIFYFVDRIGDTFRWKGENVSTSEVAEAIAPVPASPRRCVYGVAVPGTEGPRRHGRDRRRRTASISPRLRRHLDRAPAGLCAAAVPAHRSVRSRSPRRSSTRSSDLVREGYDPARPPTRSISTIRERQAFVRLDRRALRTNSAPASPRVGGHALTAQLKPCCRRRPSAPCR